MQCCVRGCFNSKLMSEDKRLDVKLVEFPENVKQRERWERLVGVTDVSPTLKKDLRICTEHFISSAISDNKVAPDIVPTRKLPVPGGSSSLREKYRIKKPKRKLPVPDGSSSLNKDQSIKGPSGVVLKRKLPVPDWSSSLIEEHRIKVPSGVVPTQTLPVPSDSTSKNLIDQEKLQSRLKSHLMSLVLKDQKNSVDLTQHLQKEANKKSAALDENANFGTNTASSQQITNDEFAENDCVTVKPIQAFYDSKSKKIILFLSKGMTRDHAILNAEIENNAVSSETPGRKDSLVNESSIAPMQNLRPILPRENPKKLREYPKTVCLQSVSEPLKPAGSQIISLQSYSKKNGKENLSGNFFGAPNILRRGCTSSTKVNPQGFDVMIATGGSELASNEVQNPPNNGPVSENDGLEVLFNRRYDELKISENPSEGATEVDGLNLLDDERCYFLDPVTAAQLEREFPSLLNVELESNNIPNDTQNR